MRPQKDLHMYDPGRVPPTMVQCCRDHVLEGGSIRLVAMVDYAIMERNVNFFLATK